MKLQLRLMIASVAVATALPALASSAQAASVPFSDPSSTGYIGLCNRQEQQITSGSLRDVPFVWTAVASVPGPPGYDIPGTLATLFYFQPIQNELPGNWNAFQLTGSAGFTNLSHPMVQATNGDYPLIGAVAAFPPKWDGLVQLRMYYSGHNHPINQRTYPTAVIRITGNTWTEVTGGKVNCTDGHAVSDETQVLPPSMLASPWTIPGSSSSPSTTSKSGTGQSGSSSTGSGSGKGGATYSASNAHGPTGGDSGLSGWLIGLISAGGIAFIGTSALIIRRRLRHVSAG